MTKLHKAAPILVLLVAGAIAYHNSLSIPFVLDDLRTIENNPHIRSLWPVTDVLASTFRPLVQLSLAINYAIGETSVEGYHIFNLAVHLMVAVVLFALLRRLVSSDGLALAIALIWEVHPLVTQAVNYVIQRGELLMSLFYLLTLYCVVRAGKTEEARRWSVLAVIACALGMATKQTMVTAPLLALLLDVAFISHSWQQTFRARWRLYLGLAATWVILPLLMASSPADWKGSSGFGQVAVAPQQYALTQAPVLVHYLRLAFWPVGLCFDYWWPVAAGCRAVLPSLLLIGSIFALTIWSLVQRPTLGFWGACFFLVLAPTSSFMPIQDLAVEHRMYLPLVPVVVLTMLAIAWLLRRMQTSPQVGPTVTALLAVVLILVTVRRNTDYQTSESLWRDTVAKSPRNVRALTNLGNAISDDPARATEAIACYREAVRLQPDYFLAHYNWGRVLASQGDYAAAQRRYETGLQFSPSDSGLHYNLGLALARQGRLPEAIRQFEEVLKYDPTHAQAQYNIGVALEKQGKTDASIAAYQAAVALNPNFAKAHYFLALALAKAGRPAEARQHFDTAVKLSPSLAAYRNSSRPLDSPAPAAPQPTRGSDSLPPR
jgi:protein O-mannosyl-transferase